MNAIATVHSQRAASANLASCPGLAGFRLAALLILTAALLSVTGIAEAGPAAVPVAASESGAAASEAKPKAQAVPTGGAALGESLFYPCTSCHPVVDGRAAKRLPIDFKGHRIELESHDVLGEGGSACVACHEDPARDPGKLKLIDGSLGDMDSDDDVARLCYRCHSEKYKEWTIGAHGKPTGKCTSAGCHNPHAPAWIYAEPLLPFVGTGFTARAVSDRQPFTPLAGAPEPAPVYTPWWLILATGVGGVVSAGLIGFITIGRRTR